ncbi:MAG: metallophosphoesterase [Sandaracinaceae bacterium]
MGAPRRKPIKREVERALPLTDGALRLAVISDTHSKPHPNAHGLVKDLAPDAILHGGDVGDLAVLDAFRDIAEVIAVRGNIDERTQLPDFVTIRVVEDRDTRLTILLTHVAVNGPRIRADAARWAHARRASLIVCGHSHVPFLGRDRGLTVLNAGSIGPRRFHLPIVFAVIEIANRKLSLRHIDCETGEPWAP